MLSPRFLPSRDHPLANPFVESIFNAGSTPRTPTMSARRSWEQASRQQAGGTSVFLDTSSGRRLIAERPAREATTEFGFCLPRQAPGIKRLDPRGTTSSPREPFASRFASGGPPRVSTDLSPRNLRIEVYASGRVSPPSTPRGSIGVSPEKIDVHRQVHIGGNSNTVAAGIRTSQATASSAPWTMPTSKPTGFPVSGGAIGVFGCFL